MEPRDERADSIAKLRMLRDQIRVDLHLAKMDAKQRWAELEKRFQDIEYRDTGTLVLGCGRRCTDPNTLRRMLMRHPDRIAYERRIEQLEVEVERWINFARRLNRLSGRFDGRS